MSVQELDAAAVEEFGGRMVGILNDGMLALMVSVGHRTRLFDVMADLAASTSAEVADAAELDERYVREWLGAMTTGGIVEHDPEAGTYALPAEHAAMLTRAAGTNNLAATTQFVALMGKVETDVVECFRSGGGVPYSSFPEFQSLMAEESAAVFDAALLDVTLPLAGAVESLAAGIDVADIGCGKGHAVNLMAEAFPNSRFVGYDFSEEGVAAGRAEAAEKGLTNATFEVKDVSNLGHAKAFDLVTAFDAIHDQRDPARVLSGIHDALRPGGTFLCVDVKADSSVAGNLDHPLGPMLYTVSTMHCMTVSLALGGAGLGTMWGEQKAREMLAEAGFVDVAVHTVGGDIINNYYVAKRP